MPSMPETITVRVPMAFRRRGGRKRVVAPDGQELVPAREPRVRIDSTLVKALARAFRWRRMLERRAVATVAEIAARERISASYVSRVLRLTLLAPEIVEAVLDGAPTAGVTLPRLMKGVPVEWEKQRTTLSGGAGAAEFPRSRNA
ncbi:MAG: hypothetical protein AB7F35_10265 [Acetobacteraceae bacterium]